MVVMTPSPKTSLESFNDKEKSLSIHEQLEKEEEENSPFEMVREVVSNKDDPSLPVVTFRFWILGTIFTALLAFVNQFFYYRTTPLTVGLLVVQLLAFPAGKLMEKLLPSHPWFNPGPFNMKEHVLITAAASAASYAAYAIDIVTIKRVYYKSDIGFLGSFLLLISTQCIGYGLAGVTRRFLVRPAAMIWPTNLVSVSVFRTLHEEEQVKDGQMSRQRFFLLVSVLSFIWYIFPGYLAQFLACVSLLCYAAPNNRLLQEIGSGTKGFGVLSFSFDWNTIVSYLASPSVTPFWASVNTMLGFVLFCWILVPIGYYSNIWSAKTFPIVDSSLFRVNGSSYDPLAIIDPATHTLDEALFQAYGPLRITFFFAISYGAGFASLSSVLVHTLLYHGQEMFTILKGNSGAEDDIHAKLMDRYPEVPDTWYAGFFLINLALAIFVCTFYDIRLPWWAVILAVAMAALFLLPIGITTAIANTTPGLGMVTEIVIGYLLPGRPIANMTFKTYSYIGMSQAIQFLSDLKLGHYMKIPPRAMFFAQLWGTIVAGVVNLLTSMWLFHAVPNICSDESKDWQCSNTRVFYSSSVIWGVLGPAKIFGMESPYRALLWWFLLGALLPVPFWLLSRRYPDCDWLAHVHIPVIMAATVVMPPATAVMFPTWFIASFFLMFYAYRYHYALWARYNYVFSAAMDMGVAICGLLLFFTVQSWGWTVDWWGNQEDCPNLTFSS